MKDTINKNSMEYILIQEFLSKFKSSFDKNVLDIYEKGKLIYLDDDMTKLKIFNSVISELAEDTFDNVPSHAIGDLRDLSSNEIKNILSEHDIILYGRSGMRLNSLELKHYDN